MKKLLSILLGLLILSGCAPRYRPPDLSGYHWPMPPEEKAPENPPGKTMVSLVKVISSDLDIRRRTLGDIVFGAGADFVFQRPQRVASDKNGNIYVSDTIAKKVYILNLEKGVIEEFSKDWESPSGIAVDDEGGLIAIADGDSAFVFNLETRALLFTISGFVRPSGVAFDQKRRILYIADLRRNEVYAYGYDGALRATIAGEGTGEGSVLYPIDLDVDGGGRLYVLDGGNRRVQVLGPDGSFIRSFGGFETPKGLAVSGGGLVVVTDAGRADFEIFDGKGTPCLSVGKSGRGYGEFVLPHGVHIDAGDRLYVVDQDNKRLQIFRLSGDFPCYNYAPNNSGGPR